MDHKYCHSVVAKVKTYTVNKDKSNKCNRHRKNEESTHSLQSQGGNAFFFFLICQDNTILAIVCFYPILFISMWQKLCVQCSEDNTNVKDVIMRA